MSKKLEKICLFIIRLGSYLILFLPLLVYPRTLYPYIFGKIIIFRILVEIIFATWLFLAVYKREYRPDWKNPLVLSLTIFIAILVLTMFTGVDPQRSFFSTQERMTGVLTICHFWLWFIVLTSTLKAWKDWRNFIWASLACAFLVGLYGLGQKIGLKFLLKSDIRISATLGNPIYLGVYSMLHLFLAGLLILKEKKWLPRVLLIFLLIFNFLILILSQSRGAVIALAFGLFLFFIFLWSLSPPSKKRLIFVIFLISIMILISFYWWLRTEKGKIWGYKHLPQPLIRLVYYLLSGPEQRIIPWQIGIKGFLERPIFGWGWENYQIIFNKYFKPEIFLWGEASIWFDRSHNQVIDLLALTGGVGAAAYLAVFGTIFWLLLRKKRGLRRIKADLSVNLRESALLCVILVCLFLAYFIQNLFVFDTPAPLIVFYFGLALTYFVTKNTDLDIKPNLEESKIRNSKPGTNFPLPILIFLIIIFLPRSIYEFNLKPFNQSKLAVRAIAISKNDFSLGLYFYQKALKESSFANPEIRVQLAKSVVEYGTKGEADEELFKKAIEFTISQLEKSHQEHPNDVRYMLYLSKFYNLASKKDKTYLDKSEKLLEQALNLAPHRQDLLWEMGKVKLLQERFSESLNYYRKALLFEPRIAESWWNLGLAYLWQGSFNQGHRAIKKALAAGFNYQSQNPSVLLFIADSYARIKNFSEAISFCNLALKLNPENLEAMVRRTIYYSANHDKEGVKKSLEELRTLSPETAQELEKILKE